MIKYEYTNEYWHSDVDKVMRDKVCFGMCWRWTFISFHGKWWHVLKNLLSDSSQRMVFTVAVFAVIIGGSKKLRLMQCRFYQWFGTWSTTFKLHRGHRLWLATVYTTDMYISTACTSRFLLQRLHCAAHRQLLHSPNTRRILNATPSLSPSFSIYDDVCLVLTPSPHNYRTHTIARTPPHCPVRILVGPNTNKHIPSERHGSRKGWQSIRHTQWRQKGRQTL